MKTDIVDFLVNVISVIDIIKIRLCNRRIHSDIIDTNDIVLVRLDAIGDFVMWLDAAKEFKKSCTGRVVLVCNQVCSDIARSAGYFDEVIGVNYGKLRHTSQVRYRWSMHRLLKSVKAGKAIQCTYSKEIFSDVVMSAIAANEKITMDSPEAISSRWTYHFTRPIYQKVIITPKEHVMEIHRNAIFTGKVLEKRVCSGVPYIKENKDAQSKVPIERYYVLFPGASESERMWPIERFAEIAEKLYGNIEYRQMKCCLCGGKDEEYLGDLFVKKYSVQNNVINTMGQTSLLELIEIIRGAEFIITNDTSAVHFAAAVNTQAYCIWGPWEYGRFLPYVVEKTEGRKLPIVCYHEMECRNCLLDGTDKTQECKRFICENGIRKCINYILVEDVLNRILE